MHNPHRNVRHLLILQEDSLVRFLHQTLSGFSPPFLCLVQVRLKAKRSGPRNNHAYEGKIRQERVPSGPLHQKTVYRNRRRSCSWVEQKWPPRRPCPPFSYQYRMQQRLLYLQGDIHPNPNASDLLHHLLTWSCNNVFPEKERKSNCLLQPQQF